jgi:hypothetical protein
MSAHYLQPLQHTRLPARHVIFDTETQVQRHAGAHEHRYRTGAIGEGGERMWNTAIYTYETPQALWERIVAVCRKGQRTVAWAHNLSFDLRISEALRWLPRQGFHLQGIVLERTASWASWTSAKHGSLICCDLYSWLPRTLDDIARAMGVSREIWDGERYQNASLAELQARCIQDVQITRQAVQGLLGWLQAEDCGPFRLTGSGQAHACWRKRFAAGKTIDALPLREAKEAAIEAADFERARELRDAERTAVTHGGGVWVHGDPELRQLEREAMWTGRCEAWRHGDIDGPLYEYDMTLAYCRIAAQHQLPTHLRGQHGALTYGQYRQLVNEGYAVLAEITIDQDDPELEQPVVPCRVGERIIWPIGRFNTILWNPEIDLLPGYGFGIHRAWSYHTGPALKPMAEWIINGLESDDTPGPVKLLLKHWARALIGRMALRYRRWEPYGDMPDLGLSLWVGYDEDGQPTENLQVGHDRFTLAELLETDASCPQITGWVMSQCRANLWAFTREYERLGGEILYMDTDSILGRWKGPKDAWTSFPFPIDLKATWSHALIHGPRNLELDQERRLSGIPRTAVRTGPLDYEGTVMRGTKESLLRSELDHVAEITRPYHITPSDPRRERQADGTTTPYRLGGDE